MNKKKGRRVQVKVLASMREKGSNGMAGGGAGIEIGRR